MTLLTEIILTPGRCEERKRGGRRAAEGTTRGGGEEGFAGFQQLLTSLLTSPNMACTQTKDFFLKSQQHRIIVHQLELV